MSEGFFIDHGHTFTLTTISEAASHLYYFCINSV